MPTGGGTKDAIIEAEDPAARGVEEPGRAISSPVAPSDAGPAEKPVVDVSGIPAIEVAVTDGPDPAALSITELSEVSGHTVRNIRAYLQQDLLPTPEKQGRSLVFTTDHVRRLRQIDYLRDRGYSLQAIRDLVQGERDAVVTDDFEAMRTLVDRWLLNDRVAIADDEFDRTLLLLGRADERQELTTLLVDVGIIQPTPDGWVLVRPELLGVALQLAAQGLSGRQFLAQFDNLRHDALKEVLDVLIGQWQELFAAYQTESEFRATWTPLAIALTSEVTRMFHEHLVVVPDPAPRPRGGRSSNPPLN